MRLLVTGGAGFIGTNFVYYWLDKYKSDEVTVYDKLTYAGNAHNFDKLFLEENPRFHFVKGDIVNLVHLSEVMKMKKITHVINFAAETHVDRSIHQGAREFVLTNTLGVQMILDAVNQNKIEKFVNVSTDEVYGALELDEDRKFTEDTPIMPNMPYAAAKAGGDLMCNAYFKTHKTPVVVTHCSNNYGPYQFPEKLIPYAICKLLNDHKVPVYGDGLNVRDWIHAKDHSSALDILLHRGVNGEVYNIGADNERSNLEVVRAIINSVKNMVKIDGNDLTNESDPEEWIEYIKDRPGHDRRYAIDASKIEALGWKPIYTRERFWDGLEKTVEWYLTHLEWVNDIQDKKADEMNAFQNETQNKKELH